MGFLKSIAAAVPRVAQGINLNPCMNPSNLGPPESRVDFYSPPRSIEEGQNRARLLGQGDRFVAFLRMGLTELRETPQARETFLRLIEAFTGFQRELQNRREVLDREVLYPAFSPANDAAQSFLEALDALKIPGGRDVARAVVRLKRLEGLQADSDYTSPTDEDLRGWGLAPEALENLGDNNAHILNASVTLQVLRNPRIRDLPETIALREALESYWSPEVHSGKDRSVNRATWVDLVRQAEEKTAEIGREITKTKDPARHRELEQRRKEAMQAVTRPYIAAIGPPNRAMRHFLGDASDPQALLRRRVFLVETNRIMRILVALQAAPSGFIRGILEEAMDHLTPEARLAAQGVLEAIDRWNDLEERDLSYPIRWGAAKVFGWDLEIRGAYERALGDLISRFGGELIPFAETRIRNYPSHPFLNVPDEAIETALEVETQYWRAYHELARTVRENQASLTEQNNAYWAHYDEGVIDLYRRDIELQMARATELMEQVFRVVEAREGMTAYRQKYGDAFDRLMANSRAALKAFLNPETRGGNTRDVNRTLETAIDANFNHLFDFVRFALKQEGLPGSNFRTVTLFFAPYASKRDPHTPAQRIETRVAQLRLIGTAIGTGLKILSAVGRRHTTEAVDSLLVRMARRLGRWFNKQTYAFDRNAESLVAIQPTVSSMEHGGGWPDYYGNAGNARSAILGPKAGPRDIPLTLGKKDFVKLQPPALQPTFQAIVIPVGDTLPEFDTAVADAASCLAGFPREGRLGQRNVGVLDKLTMPVVNDTSPYAPDPFPGVSATMPLPLSGRSFTIAERARILTGEPQNLLVVVPVNTYLTSSKPDKVSLFRRHETRNVAQVFPLSAFNDGGTTRHTSRANWLRLTIQRLAQTPEHRPPVPSIDRQLKPYSRPLPREDESVVEGILRAGTGVFPT